MDTPAHVVIAGAGAAALSVAETLRREGWDGRLTMIGEEVHLPYDRPPLSKALLAGTVPAERLRLRGRAELDALDLDLRLGVAAAGLDRNGRRVRLSDGSEVECDALVVATGTRARRLPGSEGVAGVHLLRTLEDAEGLRAELGPGVRLVVVGAGFLGAEAASVAVGLGCEVTLVSDLPAPLADVLGPELGALLREEHAAQGVRVVAGRGVEQLLVREGRTEGVLLADGTRLMAEVVLVAIGSLPNTSWLDGSGLALGNGVECDAYCRAAPGIWAAGDVGSWYHRDLGERLRLEHRTNAGEQGMAVARNLLAGQGAKPFTPVPYIWSDQYGLKIQIHGLPRDADRFALTEGSAEERSLLAVYGRGDRVRAAVGINRIRPTRGARALVAGRVPWSEAVGEPVR